MNLQTAETTEHNPVQNRFSLDGRVFAVTGASSGIGRSMAGFLVEAGARVVLVARRESLLTEAMEGIGPVHCQRVTADLAERNTIQNTAEECIRKFGYIDGVVNAAGINLRQSWDKITLESWDQTINLNLAAPFFFSRCFVDGMRKRGYGRIINIASLQSTRAFPNGLPYGASKAGICQLTRAMAEAWSRFAITSNAIAPGFFPTELTAPIFENEDSRLGAANQTTMGRNGVMDDLAGVTIFLASPASNYITGQVLPVDGGFTAR